MRSICKEKHLQKQKGDHYFSNFNRTILKKLQLKLVMWLRITWTWN